MSAGDIDNYSWDDSDEVEDLKPANPAPSAAASQPTGIVKTELGYTSWDDSTDEENGDHEPVAKPETSRPVQKPPTSGLAARNQAAPRPKKSPAPLAGIDLSNWQDDITSSTDGEDEPARTTQARPMPAPHAPIPDRPMRPDPVAALQPGAEVEFETWDDTDEEADRDPEEAEARPEPIPHAPIPDRPMRPDPVAALQPGAQVEFETWDDTDEEGSHDASGPADKPALTATEPTEKEEEINVDLDNWDAETADSIEDDVPTGRPSGETSSVEGSGGDVDQTGKPAPGAPPLGADFDDSVSSDSVHNPEEDDAEAPEAPQNYDDWDDDMDDEDIDDANSEGVKSPGVASPPAKSDEAGRPGSTTFNANPSQSATDLEIADPEAILADHERGPANEPVPDSASDWDESVSDVDLRASGSEPEPAPAASDEFPSDPTTFTAQPSHLAQVDSAPSTPTAANRYAGVGGEPAVVDVSPGARPATARDIQIDVGASGAMADSMEEVDLNTPVKGSNTPGQPQSPFRIEKAKPHTLIWSDLAFHVDAVNPNAKKGKPKEEQDKTPDNPETIHKQQEVLLHPTSGYALPGTVTAVIDLDRRDTGSHLFNLIGARYALSVGRASGIRTANGTRYAEAAPDGTQIGEPHNFVVVPADSEPALEPSLSAQETLSFYSDLTLSLPAEQANSRLQKVLKWYGLSDRADARAGRVASIHAHEVLSIYEQKRLLLAARLTRNPSVVLCEDPARGLDQVSSERFLQDLQALTRALSLTTIITLPVNEATWTTFRNLDSVILCSGGHVVFSGPPVESIDFFHDIGHTCPGFANPLEYYVDVAYNVPGETLAQYFLQSHSGSTYRAELNSIASTVPVSGTPTATGRAVATGPGVPKNPTKAELAMRRSTPFTPFTNQVKALLLRETTVTMRVHSLGLYRFLEAFFLAVVCAAFFYQLTDTPAGAVNRFGYFFFLQFMIGTSICLTGIPQMVQSIGLWSHETRARLYGPGAWLLVHFLSVAVRAFLQYLLFSILSYWLVGLNPPFARFISFVLLLWITHLVIYAMVFVIVLITPSNTAAVQTCFVLLSSAVLSSGFVIRYSELPDFWHFVPQILFGRYAMEFLLQNEFQGRNVCDGQNCVAGNDILAAFDHNSNPGSRAGSFFILVLFAAVWWVVAYVCQVVKVGWVGWMPKAPVQWRSQYAVVN